MKAIIPTFLIFFLFSCNHSKKTGIDSRLTEENISENINAPSYSSEDLEFASIAGFSSNKVTESFGEMKYTAKLIPVRSFLKEKFKYDNTELDSLVKELSEEVIILFEFEGDKSKDILDKEFTKLDYDKSVSYMSFEINEDFYLVAGKDTIQCANSQLERTFKLTPFKRLLLNFGGVNINNRSGMYLVYKDQLYKNGIIKFGLAESIQENNFEL